LKSSTGIINLNDCREYVNTVPLSKIKILKRNMSNKGLVNEYGCLINNHLSTDSNSDGRDSNSIEDENPRILKFKLKSETLKQKVRNLSDKQKEQSKIQSKKSHPKLSYYFTSEDKIIMRRY